MARSKNRWATPLSEVDEVNDGNSTLPKADQCTVPRTDFRRVSKGRHVEFVAILQG